MSNDSNQPRKRKWKIKSAGPDDPIYKEGVTGFFIRKPSPTPKRPSPTDSDKKPCPFDLTEEQKKALGIWDFSDWEDDNE